MSEVNTLFGVTQSKYKAAPREGERRETGEREEREERERRERRGGCGRRRRSSATRQKTPASAFASTHGVCVNTVFHVPCQI